LEKNSSSHDHGVSSQSQNIFIKSLTKLCSEKSGDFGGNWSYKLKELIGACQRRFGQEFTNKLMMNAKVVEIMSWLYSVLFYFWIFLQHFWIGVCSISILFI